MRVDSTPVFPAAEAGNDDSPLPERIFRQKRADFSGNYRIDFLFPSYKVVQSFAPTAVAKDSRAEDELRFCGRIVPPRPRA